MTDFYIKPIKSACYFSNNDTKNLQEKIKNFKKNIITFKNKTDFNIIKFIDINQNTNKQFIIIELDSFLLSNNINDKILLVRNTITKLIHKNICVGLYLKNPLIIEHFKDIISFIFFHVEDAKFLYTFVSNLNIPYSIEGTDIDKIYYYKNIISQKNKTISIDCDSKVCYLETCGNPFFI